MPDRGTTRAQYAVRVDGELGSFLRSLPNTSEFIRRAVLRQSGLLCPLCCGAGVVLCGVGEHFAEPARCAREVAGERPEEASGP